ncbi:hypothetical protein GQR58_002239 [Nymphon striatum]|nr:hypothetical protein GQR58_002239 [Nymphon striatum]
MSAKLVVVFEPVERAKTCCMITIPPLRPWRLINGTQAVQRWLLFRHGLGSRWSRTDPSFMIRMSSWCLQMNLMVIPHKTPMKRVNDLIPYKPAADVTLRAQLQSETPQDVLEGQVNVHDRVVKVRGHGARMWQHDGRWRLSKAEQIDRLDVSYALAYGGRIIGDPEGQVDPSNPVGAGIIHPDFTPRHMEFVAPQIESPSAPITEDVTRKVNPAGFGPVPPWWARRLAFAGTYDSAWEKDVHPRLPADFDYRHYQVGGTDLVMDHYLLPGMNVSTSGLMAGGNAFGFQIPDIVPVATFGFTDGREVKARLHMDGLHLDMLGETPSYELTFRAWIETCPAMYRVDLDVTTQQASHDARHPVSGLNGLVEV